MTSIYIESSDEITTVIERLKAAQDTAVSLVAPRGATLLQSVVNLKLARKAAQDAGKEIVIVSTDKIGRNLCAQLGIPVANTEEEASQVLSGATASAATEEAKVISGVRIHHYYDDDAEAQADDSAPKPDPIIIPKGMLKEEAATVPAAAIAVPDSVPEPTPPAEVVAPAVPKEPAEPLTRTKIERKDDELPTTTTPPATPGEKAASGVAGATAAGIAKAVKGKEKEPTTVTQKRIIKLSLYLGGIALLIILTIAFLFLPVTRVELSVHATDWTRQLVFSASTDLTSPSSDNTSLPAEVITATSDKTLTFTATGSKDAGDKATGTVTFYNYISNTAVVPSGTTITANGKSFTTTADSSVVGPAKINPDHSITPGTGTAPITANAAGTDSNMTNASGSNVQVGNNSLATSVTTSGGTSKTVTVVSADDLTKAKSDLGIQLADDAKQNLTTQLANREVTFKDGSDTTQAGDVTSTVKVGDQVATGDVHGTITIKRTIVNTPTLESAITDRLRADQLTNHTYQVTTKNIAVTTVSADGKLLSLTVDLAGKEAAVIPAEELVQKLGGKTLAAGEAILTDAVPTGTVTVTQKPGWWPVKRYPTVNRYILIDVKYE
jgi:hypothetical protein